MFIAIKLDEGVDEELFNSAAERIAIAISHGEHHRLGLSVLVVPETYRRRCGRGTSRPTVDRWEREAPFDPLRHDIKTSTG